MGRSRLSVEGDRHKLLKDWKAVLLGNNGPAVPQNKLPKKSSKRVSSFCTALELMLLGVVRCLV